MRKELLPESGLHDVVDAAVWLVEGAGALVIFAGAAWAFGRFLVDVVRERGRMRDFNGIRLGLGRFLALGLEFQLAGDVLRTAIAPDFTMIGQLAAIAAIRTALNYFLSREIAEEREAVERAATGKELPGKDLPGPMQAP